MHDDTALDPATVLYVPAEQAVQAVALAALNVPPRQRVHTPLWIAPSAVEKVPALHDVQDALALPPCVERKVPAVHREQALDLGAEEKVPALH